MKITKREPEQPKRTINFDKIEPGIVFRYADGAVALKLVDNEAILLVYDDDENVDWLDLAECYKTDPIERILGKLVEIVVE